MINAPDQNASGKQFGKGLFLIRSVSELTMLNDKLSNGAILGRQYGRIFRKAIIKLCVKTLIYCYEFACFGCLSANIVHKQAN